MRKSVVATPALWCCHAKHCCNALPLAHRQRIRSNRPIIDNSLTFERHLVPVPLGDDSVGDDSSGKRGSSSASAQQTLSDGVDWATEIQNALTYCPLWDDWPLLLNDAYIAAVTGTGDATSCSSEAAVLSSLLHTLMD